MQENQTPFQRWYDKNKGVLSLKRKVRYRTDPEYRDKALSNRKAQIMRKVAERGPLPEGYSSTLSEVAESMGIPCWKLRWWKVQKYYPEPYKYGREFWFTTHQMDLLERLNHFLAGYRGRMHTDRKRELDTLVSFIFSSWGEV